VNIDPCTKGKWWECVGNNVGNAAQIHSWQNAGKIVVNGNFCDLRVKNRM
jgi:hypothetical protein